MNPENLQQQTMQKLIDENKELKERIKKLEKEKLWDVIDKLNEEFDEQYHKAEELEKIIEKLEFNSYNNDVDKRIKELKGFQKNQGNIIYYDLVGETDNHIEWLHEFNTVKYQALDENQSFYNYFFEKE
tara:strand:+ start:121 stop:507 length:387 start_codon:yes stop_codon:yes gene_type:complete